MNKPGETFVIIDAGGGTVDVTTYTVHKQYPLRLKREAVEPTGIWLYKPQPKLNTDELQETCWAQAILTKLFGNIF